MHDNIESAAQVYDLIKDYHPDCIMTELCDNRYQLLQRIYEKEKPDEVMKIMDENKFSTKRIVSRESNLIGSVIQEKIRISCCD